MRNLLPGMVKISDIGCDLAGVRKAAGISKDNMAIKCGVSGLTYHRWESGATPTIKQDNFNKLKEAVEECKRIAENA